MGQISKSTFRRIADRVVERTLSAAGFHRAEKLFLRRVNGQIHGLDVQIHALEFTFNLAWHYEGLPSCARVGTPQERRQRPIESFAVTDFLMTTRVGRYEIDVANAGKDRWYPLGANPDEAAGTVEQKAQLALEAFDDVRRRWGDPRALLQALTPQVLLSEVVVPEEVSGTVEGAAVSNFILYPFFPSALVLCEALETMAESLQHTALASEYARTESVLRDRYKKRGWLS